MKRRILLATGIFPPDSGGPARFTYEFGSWLNSRNYRIQILTYAERSRNYLSVDGVSISSVRRSKSVFIKLFSYLRRLGSLSQQNSSVFAIGAFIEVYIASLVYRFTYSIKVPGDIVWERARNNHVTDLGIEDFQNSSLSLKYRLYRQLYSSSLRRAEVVIVPSQGLFQLCLGWGVPREKLVVVYNSINSSHATHRKDRDFDFDLVTVCRLVPWKGVDEIIQYCSEFNLRLAVVGDGPDSERLRNLATDTECRATFFGDVSFNEVQEVLRKSKIFVLNSYYEGLPHALLEARALGVLTVARAETGSSEVIHDNFDGFLIRPDRELVETLNLAISQEEKSEFYINNAFSDLSIRFERELNFEKIRTYIGGDL